MNRFEINYEGKDIWKLEDTFLKKETYIKNKDVHLILMYINEWVESQNEWVKLASRFFSNLVD